MLPDVTGCIYRGDISLVWYPTRDIIGDFMTKVLQGTLFQKFRHQIMGVIPAQNPRPGKPKWRLTSQATKCKKLNLIEVRVQQIFWSHLKVKGWHHRSVLGEVKCMKDGYSKNLTCMSWNVRCNKQAAKQQKRLLLSHFNQLNNS
jgi:hypothetical protein